MTKFLTSWFDRAVDTPSRHWGASAFTTESLEEPTPSKSGTRHPVVSEALSSRAFQPTEPLKNTDVGLPAEVEGDVARILARALVQQFRRDMTLPVEADHAPDEREANVVLHE
jgi:hypothetical protein